MKTLSQEQHAQLAGYTDRFKRVALRQWELQGFDVSGYAELRKPAETPRKRSLARRAWDKLTTAGKTVARFGRAAAKHVAAGMPKPPPEVIEERRSICKACPHWTGQSCKLCGCATLAKTSWAGESCPDGRWQAWSVPSPDGALVEGNKPVDESAGQPAVLGGHVVRERGRIEQVAHQPDR